MDYYWIYWSGIMKYTNKASISKKEKTTVTRIITAALILCIMGILLPVIYFTTPTVPYEDLTETQITIQKIVFHRRSRLGGAYWSLTTTDNRTFNLTGTYRAQEIEELLTQGKHATVKYCETWLGKLFGMRYAEEVVIDGQAVVSYNSPEEHPTIVLIASGLLLLLGLLGFFFAHSCVKDARRKAEKQRLRMEKRQKKKMRQQN